MVFEQSFRSGRLRRPDVGCSRHSRPTSLLAPLAAHDVRRDPSEPIQEAPLSRTKIANPTHRRQPHFLQDFFAEIRPTTTAPADIPIQFTKRFVVPNSPRPLIPREHIPSQPFLAFDQAVEVHHEARQGTGKGRMDFLAITIARSPANPSRKVYETPEIATVSVRSRNCRHRRSVAKAAVRRAKGKAGSDLHWLGIALVSQFSVIIFAHRISQS